MYSHTTAALRILEAVATGVATNEPVLLVGETGTGKTAALEHLARMVGTIIVPTIVMGTNSSRY